MIQFTPNNIQLNWQIGTAYPVIESEISLLSYDSPSPARIFYTVNQPGYILMYISGPRNGDLVNELPTPDNVKFGFQNLNTLSTGTHNIAISYRVENDFETLDSGTLHVELKVTSESHLLSISPESIVHTHTIGDLNSTHDLELECDSFWTARINGFGFRFLDDTLVQEGYGDQTLQLKLDDEVLDIEEAITLDSYIEITREANSDSVTADLTVNVRESAVVDVNPQNMYFDISLSEEFESQFLEISHSGFSVDDMQWPDFLEVEQVNAVNTEFSRFKVTPKSDYGFNPGDSLNGHISFFVDFELWLVGIFVNVAGVYDQSYMKDVHFTKDNEILRFESVTDEESFLELSATIHIFNHRGESRTVERVWELPFFKNKAEINLGLEVDNYLTMIKSPVQSFDYINSTGLVAQYRAMRVELSAKEISYNSRLVLNEYTIPQQKFLRGRSVSLSHACLLINDPNEIRKAYENGQIMLNLFRPAKKSSLLQIYKNGVLFKELNPAGLLSSVVTGFAPVGSVHEHIYLFGIILNIKDEGFTAGDEILIRYGMNKLNYIVYPAAQNIDQITFVNEWELMDLFEFTGRRVVSSSLEHVTAGVTNTLHKRLGKFGTSDEQRLVFDTGFVFKHSIKHLYQLGRSRLAFLMHRSVGINRENEAQRLEFTEIIPVPASFQLSDSKAESISHKVEFVINKKNDNEVYSL